MKYSYHQHSPFFQKATYVRTKVWFWVYAAMCQKMTLILFVLNLESQEYFAGATYHNVMLIYFCLILRENLIQFSPI